MQKVALETIFEFPSSNLLVNRVAEVLMSGVVTAAAPVKHSPVGIPAIATRRGVPGNVYDAYRLGLTSFCADAVLVQEVNGEPKVPFITRGGPPFGGIKWIMGGVVPNFRPIQQFLLWKIHRECGLDKCEIDEFVNKYQLTDEQYSCNGVHIVGYLGLARTAADDTDDATGKVCDTLNLCGMAVLHGVTHELYHDRDHTSIHWMGEKDLVPGVCGHWYPEWAAKRAISIYRDAQKVVREHTAQV